MRFDNLYHRRSDPAGVDIVANEQGVDLLIGGSMVMGLSLVREHGLVVPMVRMSHAGGTESLTVADTRLRLASVTIPGAADELIRAFEEHERLWRAVDG